MVITIPPPNEVRGGILDSHCYICIVSHINCPKCIAQIGWFWKRPLYMSYKIYTICSITSTMHLVKIKRVQNVACVVYSMEWLYFIEENREQRGESNLTCGLFFESMLCQRKIFTWFCFVFLLSYYRFLSFISSYSAGWLHWPSYDCTSTSKETQNYMDQIRVFT